MNLYIFLGGPGSGKGTQAEKLSETLGFPHISTGQLFRQHMKDETPLGLKITEVMNSGKLVSDDLVMEVVKDRLSQDDCQEGAILDGVPRTIPQAEAFKKLTQELEITQTHVIYIEVTKEEMVTRINGRRTCSKCGHTFHDKYSPAKVEGKCDFDGNPLVQRKEDAPGAQEVRLKIFEDATLPLVDFYKDLDYLVTVNGHHGIQEVHNELYKKLHI